jgi:chromate transporter
MKPSQPPTLRSFALLWLKLGCLSFGGPGAHIGLIHREVVERKKWIDERRFSNALGFCMLLPGPEAQQLATYIGWMLHGAKGGAIAGGLFVLPSALLLWGLSVGYVLFGASPYPAAFLAGLLPVVAALVATAAWRMARRSLQSPIGIAFALAGFALMLPGKLPVPLLLVAALISGFSFPKWFAIPDKPVSEIRTFPHQTGRAALVTLLLWIVPVGLLLVFERGLLAQLAVFFSATSLLTFGGAYVILPYVFHHSVAAGWIGTTEVLDGLGLAEATPGPLIIVLQFIGFLAAWSKSHAILFASLGALVATWTTFLPSFVWIFFGAPHIERMLANRRMAGALSGVGACATGIIAGLALWIAWQAFLPSPGHPDWPALAVFLAALAAQRAGALPLVLFGGAVGILRGITGW